MNTKDIRNALKSRLAFGSIGPGVAWPNVEYGAGRPYFATSFTGVVREGGTLKGGEVLVETGQFTPVVVVDQGEGEDSAADYADAVAALFPEGLRLPISGGEVTVTRPADIRGGYQTDIDYRMPVAIFYEATAT